jgi:hypothetical protein
MFGHRWKSMLFVACAAFIGASAVQFAPAFAAEQSGEVVGVTKTALANGSRSLDVNSPVFMGDVIKTDQRGEAQLHFRDDTRMVVGPNSEMTIDSFVFQNSGSARKVSIDVVRGAFRFITGHSAKQAYSITTPTATIGVRGTEFDVTLGADGATNLALYGGAVRLCDTVHHNCADVSGTCSIAVVSPNADLRRVNNVYERSAMMESIFPYAFNQSWLHQDFHVQSRSCNVQNFTPNSSPGHGGEGGSGGGGGDGGG